MGSAWRRTGSGPRSPSRSARPASDAPNGPVVPQSEPDRPSPVSSFHWVRSTRRFHRIWEPDACRRRCPPGQQTGEVAVEARDTSESEPLEARRTVLVHVRASRVDRFAARGRIVRDQMISQRVLASDVSVRFGVQSSRSKASTSLASRIARAPTSRTVVIRHRGARSEKSTGFRSARARARTSRVTLGDQRSMDLPLQSRSQPEIS